MNRLLFFIAMMATCLVSNTHAWATNFPDLNVTEPELGSWEFEETAPPVALRVWASAPLNFSWVADASTYGGTIQDYRYGWDIRNPENDDEWDQSWCSTCLVTEPRNFSTGTHTLHIQARDNTGAITHAVFVLNIFMFTLTLQEPTLGTWDVMTRSPEAILLETTPGNELNFSWQASDETLIYAYRHGWDLSDLQDDAEWTPWCSPCLSAPSRSFSSGSHTLHVQMRDDSMQLISTVSIVIGVNSVAAEPSSWSRIKSLYKDLQ